MGLYNTPDNFHCKYLVVPLSKWPTALARQWWATEGSPLYFYIQGYLFSFFLMRQPLSGRKLSWSLSNGPQTTSSFMALIIQTKVACCLASNGSWAYFNGNFSFSLPSAPATTFAFKFLSYETNIYPSGSPRLQRLCLKFSEFSSVQLLSHVCLFATPWTAARQGCLSITSSQSPPKLMSIESVILSNYLSSVIPFSSCPQSFPASGSFQMSQLFPSAGQSTEVTALASVLPMNTQDWSPLQLTGWISLQSKWLSRVFSNTTVQKHQFFGTQLSL